MKQWLKEGKIKTKHTFYEGIHSIPEALFGLFQSANAQLLNCTI